MVAHLDHEHRKGQPQRDPESPGHVDQFRIGRIVERDLFGLQRHAADRTTARTDLPHLRMHRTGVDGAGRRRRFRLLRREEFFRLGLKALAAARAAEEILLPAVAEAVFGGLRVDAHAANRIDRDRHGLAGAFIVLAVLAAAAGRHRRPGAVVMAGIRRAGTVCMLHVRHQSLPAPCQIPRPGPLNYIP
jgi:hypothetical protein